jgi:hypothetical protein
MLFLYFSCSLALAIIYIAKASVLWSRFQWNIEGWNQKRKFQQKHYLKQKNRNQENKNQIWHKIK